MGGIFDYGDGEVDFPWAVVGGGGDGVEARSNFRQERGELGGIYLKARRVSEDIHGIAVGYVGVEFDFVGANFLKAIATWAGRRFLCCHFHKLFARPIQDSGCGDGFGELGIPAQSEFSEKFSDEAVGVTREDSEGISANVGGASGAEFNDDVAGIFFRSLFVEEAILADLCGEGMIPIEGRGGGLGGGGHGNG